MAYGLHKQSVQEGINARNGQAGLDVIAQHDSDSQTPGKGNWIALQCVPGAAPGTTAYTAQFIRLVSASSNIGDDLGATFMQPGDIIYGNFASVINHTDSNAILLGYRG